MANHTVNKQYLLVHTKHLANHIFNQQYLLVHT